MRKTFTEYYSSAVKEHLDSSKALDDINVDLRLTVLKPLHAQWLVDTYEQLLYNRRWETNYHGRLGEIEGASTHPGKNYFAAC